MKRTGQIWEGSYTRSNMHTPIKQKETKKAQIQ
jgi:hypothetical protein